jgi:hypothetical protein
MNDFKTQVNGMTYVCRSDGTSLARAISGYVAKVVVVRGFIEVNGNRYVLKEISKDAFRCCAIKSIRIPSSVEVIGKECFYNCESLCEVTFESVSKLTVIGNCAFYECGIKSIRIPSSVEVIGTECFYDCFCLCEVTFESISKLKGIGRHALCNTGVDTMEIPAGCESLTGLSLNGLKSVTVSNENQFFTLRDSFVMNLSGTVLIRYFGGDESILIPSYVEIISEGCFSDCESLFEVTFESISQLKDIGRSAFYKCGIKSIRIPSNVEVIGAECFWNCKSLCEVAFESCSNLREIHRKAFDERLERVRIPLGFTVEYNWPDNCRIEYCDEAI